MMNVRLSVASIFAAILLFWGSGVQADTPALIKAARSGDRSTAMGLAGSWGFSGREGVVQQSTTELLRKLMVSAEVPLSE